MEPASSAPPTPAVAIRGLVKRFDDVIAVDGLDLTVERGECFGLLGPNGAGKTTTLEILIGLQRPTAGEVRVLDTRWGDDDHALRARIGVALQETRLPERLTVREVLALFRSFHPRGLTVVDALRQVGLEEKADAWTMRLSGGQRQRLALACALVGDPELLVLDEPTTGLDPQARLLIGDHVLSYRRRGRTVVVSTHYMDEAERLCDRVAVVDHGKVIALGTPAELIARLGGALVIEFTLAEGAIDEATLRAIPGVHDVWRSGAQYVVSAVEAHATVPALLALLAAHGTPLSQLATRHATLEDVFVTLTGRHLRDE